MTKYLLILPFSLIFSFGFGSSQSARQNFAVNLVPTPTPVVQDDSEVMVLDKDEVCIECKPGYRPSEGSTCDHDMSINVSVNKHGNNNLKYEYTISGGRIIGEGAQVIWDMTGAQPGTYQIRVDIENNLNGQKLTEIKISTVKEDHKCFMDCDCPTLSVDAPKAPIKAGETMTFTASVSGYGETVTYDWTISEGRIIEGQGTPVIIVATNAKMAGKTVKATVDIGGVCEECLKTAEAVGTVAETKRRKK